MPSLQRDVWFGVVLMEDSHSYSWPIPDAFHWWPPLIARLVWSSTFEFVEKSRNTCPSNPTAYTASPSSLHTVVSYPFFITCDSSIESQCTHTSLRSPFASISKYSTAVIRDIRSVSLMFQVVWPGLFLIIFELVIINDCKSVGSVTVFQIEISTSEPSTKLTNSTLSYGSISINGSSIFKRLIMLIYMAVSLQCSMPCDLD